MFRRYRDLSIFAFIGVYSVSYTHLFGGNNPDRVFLQRILYSWFTMSAGTGFRGFPLRDSRVPFHRGDSGLCIHINPCHL